MCAVLTVVYLFSNYELAMRYSESWLLCEKHLRKIVAVDVDEFLRRMNIIHKQLEDSQESTYSSLANVMEWALTKNVETQPAEEEDTIADAKNVGVAEHVGKSKSNPVPNATAVRKLLEVYQDHTRMKVVMDAHFEFFHECMKDCFPGLALRVPRRTQVDFVRKKFQEDPHAFRLDSEFVC